MRFRWLWLFVLAGLVVAACSQSDPAATDAEATDEPPSQSPQTTPEETATPPPDDESDGGDEDSEEPRVASDRIVVVDAAQLSTMLPDGSDVVPLTTDDAYLNLLPTWSPDGTRIAWTKVERATGAAQIATSRFDASTPYDVDVASPPFYLYWDPASRQVAYLNPSPGGIDLGVVDISGEGTPRRIDRGQPYYFAWSPDGEEMLVHASTLRLDRIDLEGTTVIIDQLPGTFQAPAWSDDARALIYAQQTDDGDLLVSSGTDGEGRLELASYDGYLTFVVSPASNRIALQVIDPTNLADPGVVTASAPRAQPDFPTPELPTGELAVIATFGSDLISLSSVAASAFFWSPDGQSLAWIEPTTVDGQLWYQWFFFTSDGFLDGPVFRPSDTLLTDYFPFFDQFAKAITFWSPESDQIVFAGTVTDGEEGVFVFDVEFGGETRRIADGDFAAWSPTVAGDAASSAL